MFWANSGLPMEAELSDNVQVVVQTGGAAAWQNETVEAGVIGGYRLL